MTTELYQVELRGNDVVFRALQQMDQEARRAAESFSHASRPSIEAASTFSSRANGLADAFKMVSRDIGTLGGAGVQTFTHMADEALSIVGVLTGGFGVTAAIAGVGVAAGVLSRMWQEEETEKREKTKKLSEELQKQKDLIAEIAKGIIKSGRETTQADFEQTQAEIKAADAVIGTKLSNLEVTKALHVANIDDVMARREMVTNAENIIAKLREENAERRARLETMREELRLQGGELADKEIIGDLEKVEQGKADKRKEANKKKEADDEERWRKEREAADRAADFGMAWDRQQQARAQAAEDAQTERLARMDEDERRSEAEREAAAATAAQEDAARFSEQEQRDRDRLSGLQAQDAATRTALENERAATQALREEQELQERAAKMATAAQIGQAVVMMAATPIVAELSSQVHELAMANRETYRDLIFFSKEFPALIAAKAQAVLAGIAAEATGRAAMEGAEALAMVGLGLGYMAIPGMQGFAAPAFASAAQHAAAAAAFGALGGASLAGAMAIGTQRGEGGMVALTSAERESLDSKREAERRKNMTEEERWQEEQDRSERKKAWQSSMGYGSGPGGGSASNSGEMKGGGRPTIIVNVNNEPGSIAGQDQERAAAEVARHVQRAQRDWFTRYEMEH